MMRTTFAIRLFAVLAALMVPASSAAAQNFDARGRLRFGVFAQGYAMQGDETRPALASASLNGYGVGASFGYDYSLGHGWIIGAEADGVATDGSKTIAGSTYNTDYFATFRGRIGYEVHPHLLIYGTGGYALNGLHYRGLTTVTGSNPNGILKQSATIGGGVVGGGIEWRFYETIVFGEYLYAPFQSWDFTGGFGVNHSIDTDAHQFRIGVKWVYGQDYYVDDIRPHR